jgi:O-antigen/teichoic acid export membrane protein
VLIGFLSLGIGLLAYPIIHLLFGSAFDESAPVMQILLPGVVLLTVFKVMNMDLAGKGKPWISLKSMWFPLILNVVLNVLLIPRYGSVGAAMSSLVTYSLASFFFLHFYSKETGIPVADILRYQKSDWEPILYLFQKLAKKQ